MAGGGFCTGAPARVRIKGRTASCIRFFLIAVAFFCPWVLITSELGYYSRVYGPQILLELSIAFNLPAIPVLIISGQVEKALDAQLGPIPSMLVRLMTGLAGCTACCAAFPFIPATHTALLWLTAVLGMLSAIAFSTAYQLVQWFRHADIIALGIGGVATGPLVLLLQLALNVEVDPKRWQWIAMFEVTAAVTVFGMVAACSLFAQYWKVLTGEEEYIDPRKPLLGDMSSQDEEECAREETNMKVAKAAAQKMMLPPDPMSVLLSQGAAQWLDEDERGVPYLKRSATLPSQSSSWASIAGRHHSPEKRAHILARTRSSTNADLRSLRSTSRMAAVSANQRADSFADMSFGAQRSATSAFFMHAQSAFTPAADDDDDEQLERNDTTVQIKEGQEKSDPKTDGEDSGSDSTAQMTLHQETMSVLKDAWQVFLAFSVAVVITYTVFPFFTYVPSSGLVSDISRVLFFGRIFADIAGRFAPRRKALMIHSPTLLLSFAGLKASLAVLFFVYIKGPARYHHDMLSLAIILVIWLLGGYINTSANIMAPSVVRPALVGRASAILALLFQVAHFGGLVLAVLLAYVLYGDVVG